MNLKPKTGVAPLTSDAPDSSALPLGRINFIAMAAAIMIRPKRK